MKTLLSLLLVLPLAMNAATFYVATYGNDSNDGTATNAANARLTIAGGLQLLSADDTLEILAGTYAERIGTTQIPNGSSGKTIVKRYQSDVVWLIPPAASENVITLGSGKTKIRIDGLSLSATNVTGGQNAIKITDSANNIEIINCPQIGHVMDGHGILISEGNGGTGGILISNNVISDVRYISGSDNHLVYVSGVVTNVSIKNNVIHTGNLEHSHGIHCYGGQYTDVEISGNTVHSTQRGIGLYTSTNAASLVFNNVCYSNRGGIRITFNGGGNRVMNNTVWKTDVGHGIEIGSQALTNEVVNNISVSNSNRGLVIASGTAVTTVTNNLVVDNTLGNILNSDSDTVLSGNITDNAADPALTDPENGDFTLVNFSAARNAGISLSATFTIDKAGTSRPQESTWDIGAFEYDAGGQLPLITVAVIDNAFEEGLVPGQLRFTRTGSTTGNLPVNFTLTGSTATSGTDYTSIGTSVTITNGLADADVLVTPLQDTDDEPTETVKPTISADAGYTVGTPDNATLSIFDNDDPPTVAGGSPRIIGAARARR